MGIKCPKCQFENPDNSVYCGKCASPLKATEEISLPTKTLQIPMKKLKVDSVFAGRYQILEELGKGGMGRVYKALDKEINEEVAIKLLKHEIASDESTIERFRNELKFARKISHKNVCRMYHLAKEEETPYITMEYVEGEDLKSLVKRKGKIPEEEVLSIARQVCEGLAEAHELGVVHRDLKPQNIMIDEKGRTRIMDFGIARSIEAPGVTQTGVMIGTPDYISPEQAEGEEADQRSDIYSLGVILYEIVTGSVPFKGDTAFSVALKHKAQIPQDPRKLNPEISEDLSRLILICMEKDKGRRYQTAKDLLSDLRNLEEGFPLGTKKRPRRETFVAPLIRKKFFLPASVAILAVIAVIIWQLLPQKEAVPSAPSGKPSLAVVYFENNTGDESLDYLRKAFSDLLISDLSQSKYLDVLPGDRIFKILEDLNQLEAKSYSSDVLKEIASQGGVENILQGSFTKAGDTFRVNIMLQNTRTGETIGSERAEGEGEESMFLMVDELTPKIKANFNLSPEEIAADIDKQTGNITTSSPEAYKHFSEGLKYLIKGDFSLSNQFLKRAVAIDPEFATAYRFMAGNYYNMGYTSMRNKYMQKAFELSDRLPDRERYSIQGAFYQKSEKTYDKAFEALNKLLEIYPDDRTGNNSLGWIYIILEEWDKAIERYEVNIRNKIEAFNPYYSQAWAYMAKGLYGKAREICENYINTFSDHFEIRFNLAISYLCQGKYDHALDEANKAFSLDPLNHWNLYLKGFIHHCKGDLVRAEKEYQKTQKTEEGMANIFAEQGLSALYLLQGKLDGSREHIKQAIEWAENLGEMEYQSWFHSYLAYLFTKSGEYDEAIDECNKAWNSAVEAEALSCKRIALYYKGLAFLEKKSMDKAKSTAGELKELIDKGLNKKAMRCYYHLMGMIELERENISKAIEYFKQAIPLLPSQSQSDIEFYLEHALIINSIALAYYREGDFERAREEYEKITSLTTGRLLFGDIYAKSFYMLGKIYQEKRKKKEAIRHYEKFLNLWKDADSGITEVEDVKKMLAGLMQ